MSIVEFAFLVLINQHYIIKTCDAIYKNKLASKPTLYPQITQANLPYPTPQLQTALHLALTTTALHVSPVFNHSQSLTFKPKDVQLVTPHKSITKLSINVLKGQHFISRQMKTDWWQRLINRSVNTRMILSTLLRIILMRLYCCVGIWSILILTTVLIVLNSNSSMFKRNNVNFVMAF